MHDTRTHEKQILATKPRTLDGGNRAEHKLVANYLLIIPLLLIQFSTADLSSISMATDKARYVQGELINLSVRNSFDIPIWYIGYPHRDLVFWELERADDNSWKHMDFRLPMIEGGIEVCRIVLYERPIGVVMELKRHSVLLYEWNQKICPFKIKRVPEPFKPEMLGRGRYRFALRYSLDTVKSKDIESEPWKRPIDLSETKVLYSNEFVLE